MAYAAFPLIPLIPLIPLLFWGVVAGGVALINFLSYNALRIAREQYMYGLASGEIISDEVRGGFTERITTMLNEADAGLINILRANARPFLQEELAPNNPLVNWQRVQNRLIEVAIDTYDRIFVRITCINPVDTAALHKACAEHNQWREGGRE